MKKIALWVLTLIISFGINAEPKKLLTNKNYLTGIWQGTGWMMKDNKKVDFFAASKVKYVAEKQIMVDESIGFTVDTIKNDTTIIYNPLTVFISDTVSKQIRAWIFAGEFPDVESVVKDSSSNILITTYKYNSTYYKSIDDCSVPNYRTVKYFTSKDDKNWIQNMEIKYSKSSKFSALPNLTKLDTNMVKIGFVSGNWFGTGSYNLNGKKNTFTMVEQVEPTNLGFLFKLEGKSMSIEKDTVAKSINSKILSNYYGVIFYNPSAKKYYTHYFYSDGRNTVASIAVNSKDKILQWEIPQGANKLTQKVDYKVKGQRTEQLYYTNPKTNTTEVYMDINMKQSSGVKSNTKSLVKPMPVPVEDK